jgi:protoporphyrin/coproporphyrin ferrochelatase
MCAAAERGPVGLVVMAYGAPSSPDEIEPYYTHIRRGRPPTDHELADLRQRYDAIGGLSPLRARTDAQAAAIGKTLEAEQPGRWRLAVGYKHTAPFLEDAVARLAAEVDSIVGLVMTPHWSHTSTGVYHDRAAAASAETATAYRHVGAWHDEPAWLDAMAQRVRATRAGMPERTMVLFTAHSLPERVLEGDPYPDQLWESARAIADRAGLDPWYGWSLAWQSAGRTPEPWRGPDVTEAIAELGATGRAAGVLVCPQGFAADHLEVLYDLDIAAAAVAADAGLAFGRTDSLNDEPSVMAALARRVSTMAARSPEDERRG